jgi:uncharacterized peroxidase-related enzyme
MAHILTQPELPGIVGLFAARPQAARPLTELAQTLLHGESPLSKGERELIAAFVSGCNRTVFCALSHGAAAAYHLGDRNRVEVLWAQGPEVEQDARLRALLYIAEAVTRTPQGVTSELIVAAREAGADDLAIHDTVLLAAAFCMYNRYVDGLATHAPDAFDEYLDMGKTMATEGYVRARPGVPVGG